MGLMAYVSTGDHFVLLVENVHVPMAVFWPWVVSRMDVASGLAIFE
jgi:hypothetical protein